jgi:hypothetical protein
MTKERQRDVNVATHSTEVSKPPMRSSAVRLVGAAPAGAVALPLPWYTHVHMSCRLGRLHDTEITIGERLC